PTPVEASETKEITVTAPVPVEVTAEKPKMTGTNAAALEEFLNLNKTVTQYNAQTTRPLYEIDTVCLPLITEFTLEDGTVLKGVGVDALRVFTFNYFGHAVSPDEISEVDGIMNGYITFVGRCYSVFEREVNKVTSLGAGVYNVEFTATDNFGEAFAGTATVMENDDSSFGFNLLDLEIGFYDMFT
ncbi:MAG: hypothetical protein LBQ48_03710, partial [Oscillospiraceae bacterium]|nr:hypothetical protein [Oscillospiraceae bacterium]